MLGTHTRNVEKELQPWQTLCSLVLAVPHAIPLSDILKRVRVSKNIVREKTIFLREKSILLREKTKNIRLENNIHSKQHETI